MAKSLLARIKITDSASPRRHLWIDKLPAKQQKQLQEVKRAFRAKELPHSARQIYSISQEALQLKVSLNSFMEWLRNDRSQKAEK